MDKSDLQELTLEEHKQTALQILIAVAEFCEENNLNYYLAYGTLIGAVRHKGFIPWDDDIDIQMPRDDYERFILLFNKIKKQNNLVAISPYDPISKHTMLKVCNTDTIKIENGVDYQNRYLGVDIDVFPLDGQPLNERTYNRYYKKKMMLYFIIRFMNLDTKSCSFKAKLVANICKAIFTKKRILKRADKLAALYPYHTSQFIGATSCLYNSKKNRYLKRWYSQSIKVEFEGEFFNAPSEYDLILKALYGDYMQVPPVSQQVTHHENKVYKKQVR